MPTSPAVIVWAAQMSTVTFHPWASVAPTTDLPDQLRLGFDPAPGTGFAEAVRAAGIACEVLDLWSWPSYAKTSGGRGVHVNVAIIPRYSLVEVRVDRGSQVGDAASIGRSCNAHWAASPDCSPEVAR
ncbi:MAG: hypothetical protein HQ453_02140 [Actinobacteria bacterium]|nr:hypothetical protein [Actinomycetota bacterium]